MQEWEMFQIFYFEQSNHLQTDPTGWVTFALQLRNIFFKYKTEAVK